jgi:hypothetical protein
MGETPMPREILQEPLSKYLSLCHGPFVMIVMPRVARRKIWCGDKNRAVAGRGTAFSPRVRGATLP